MNGARAGGRGVLGVALGATLLCAGDLSSYRGFQFGMDLSAAAKQAGTKPSEARVLHQRPAVIQEMEWQNRPRVPTTPVKADPVEAGVLSFFNGTLFRIAVTYDRYKVEGMTAEDMIEGISAIYGEATRPAVEIAYHSVYGESAAVIARWEDAGASYNLIRTGDRSGFAMVLYSKRLEALAQAATNEALRLDAQEAPQREIEEQIKREAAERLVQEKARSVNKVNFRP